MWRDVLGYEGLYKISDNGQVKSLGRTTIGSGGRGGPTLRSYPSKILVPQQGGHTFRERVNLYKKVNGSKVQTRTFYVIDLVKAAWGGDVAAKLIHIQKRKQGAKPRDGYRHGAQT